MPYSILRPFRRLGLRNGLLVYLAPLMGAGFAYSSLFENKSGYWSGGRITAVVLGFALLIGGVFIIAYMMRVREDDSDEADVPRRPRRAPPPPKPNPTPSAEASASVKSDDAKKESSMTE